jgi:heat shock protein 4
MGFYLTKLKKYFEKAEIMTKDVVLSIPSYCSNVERQSLLDAAEIAGLKCLRVINESTAIALNYGFFRKKMLDAKEARVVAFVDLGHSKTTVTIASFVQGKTKIICHKSDRNLGARDFDWEIMQVIGGKFAEKFGNDPRKNARCVIRMLEAIEKARKIISSGPDSNINVDYLLDEEDLVHNLKREEFEEICDPILGRYFALLKATVKEAGK